MESMTLPTTVTSPLAEKQNAMGTLNGTSASGWTQPLMQSGVGNCWTATDTSLPAALSDREDREAYLEASIEQDVAWQIRLNREARGLSQKDLADLIGSKQSSIARAEDTAYGRHSITTLVKIAHAFGCALLVRFVSYKEFLKTTEDTSVEALTVRGDE